MSFFLTIPYTTDIGVRDFFFHVMKGKKLLCINYILKEKLRLKASNILKTEWRKIELGTNKAYHWCPTVIRFECRLVFKLYGWRSSFTYELKK